MSRYTDALFTCKPESLCALTVGNPDVNYAGPDPCVRGSGLIGGLLLTSWEPLRATFDVYGNVTDLRRNNVFGGGPASEWFRVPFVRLTGVWNATQTRDGGSVGWTHSVAANARIEAPEYTAWLRKQQAREFHALIQILGGPWVWITRDAPLELLTTNYGAGPADTRGWALQFNTRGASRRKHAPLTDAAFNLQNILT